MRQVPKTLTDVWRSGQYIGATRPMARVTVERPQVKLHPVPDNLFSSILWDPDGNPVELPNVRSVSWVRSVDSDIATATISLWNTKPLPLGQQPTSADLDQLGYYTPQRGTTTYSSQWGHTPNEFVNLLLPDNLIKTYEGYGFDKDVCPSQDPNLVQTGVWRIDDVAFSSQGTIEISCRDLASILEDQIAFPPVVPFEAGPKSEQFPRGKYAYPVQFQATNPAPTVSSVPLDPQRVPLSFDDTSNTPYISGGANGWYRGHRGSEAFDEFSQTYWLSVGNPRPDQGYSFEWAQGSCKKTTVSEVRFRTKGSGYTAYIGIYADGEWQTGSDGGMVPYDRSHPYSAPNGSDVNYVKAVSVPSEDEVVVSLPEPIDNVTKVRVTLANLWDSGLGNPRWRGGFRDIRAYGGQLTQTVTYTQDIANYNWYDDIVRLFLAWGGFYWPETGAVTRSCDGTETEHNFTVHDPAVTIPRGRVWADIKSPGTYGPRTLDIDKWDKKPLLDCIRQVAEILGYLFYIDETGGAVFRPPNIYSTGNLLRSLSRESGRRVGTIPRIEETLVLTDLTSRLSGANLRERVFVSNTDGSLGHMAQGWNPNPIGLRRIGGWSDAEFSTQGECRVMAEMITLRQLFTYRVDTVSIPANPELQVDDQVRIFERVTNEGFIHYVRGITSTNDLESGSWTYDMETHWLGERPFTRWAFDPRQLADETQRYLNYLYRTEEERV